MGLGGHTLATSSPAWPHPPRLDPPGPTLPPSPRPASSPLPTHAPPGTHGPALPGPPPLAPRSDTWRHVYVLSMHKRAWVDAERARGITYSYNNPVSWQSWNRWGPAGAGEGAGTGEGAGAGAVGGVGPIEAGE